MAKLDNLVKEFLNGNKDSFDLIYEETKKSVYLSIYQIIKDKSAIDDLIQDTYLKAIEKMDSYKLGSNFNAWISTIARNNAINYYNKRSRVDLIEDKDYDEDLSSNDSTPLIDMALSILDGDEKDVFVYHIILGYKFKDISKILDSTLKHVFYIYQKAIKKIKEQL